MRILAYYCGEFSHMFSDRDTEEVAHMCIVLDTPAIDTWRFQLENGDPVIFWRSSSGTIHGNIYGHDVNDIPESSIANGQRRR